MNFEISLQSLKVSRDVLDPQMETILQPFQEQVEELRRARVGSTMVKLQGAREECRQRECSMGKVPIFSKQEETA